VDPAKNWSCANSVTIRKCLLTQFQNEQDQVVLADQVEVPVAVAGEEEAQEAVVPAAAGNHQITNQGSIAIASATRNQIR
jgi:hypothetical protein